MKHRISILNHRVGFLLSELGTSITVIKQGEEYTQVEITIESGYDLLNLFHAGVRTGLKVS